MGSVVWTGDLLFNFVSCFCFEALKPGGKVFLGLLLVSFVRSSAGAVSFIQRPVSLEVV